VPFSDKDRFFGPKRANLVRSIKVYFAGPGNGSPIGLFFSEVGSRGAVSIPVPHGVSQREIRLIATAAFLVGAEIELARLEIANSQLSEQLNTRKTVERAKGILQRDLQLSEEKAYLALQTQSRQRRKPMREVAEASWRQGDPTESSGHGDAEPEGTLILGLGARCTDPEGTVPRVVGFREVKQRVKAEEDGSAACPSPK
jgi:hypothetical protein